MNKRSYFVFLMVILFSLLLVSCGVKSVAPEVSTGDETQETPKAQSASDQDDQDTDLIDPGCHMGLVFIEVRFDHRWTWSPDGTANTGAYIGVMKDKVDFILKNDGYGNLASNTQPINFTQTGDIIGTDGKCTIKDGKGVAEMMLYGTCAGGVITLEWVEVHTGEGSASMKCDDGKTYGFATYHPVQFFTGVELGDDGMAYKSSGGTDGMFFRDVSMEWTFNLITTTAP